MSQSRKNRLWAMPKITPIDVEKTDNPIPFLDYTYCNFA